MYEEILRGNHSLGAKEWFPRAPSKKAVRERFFIQGSPEKNHLIHIAFGYRIGYRESQRTVPSCSLQESRKTEGLKCKEIPWGGRGINKEKRVLILLQLSWVGAGGGSLATKNLLPHDILRLFMWASSSTGRKPKLPGEAALMRPARATRWNLHPLHFAAPAAENRRWTE